MWHSDMNRIFMEHGQMKIAIILRCHKMKTLFGHTMTGVFLWLCCMIVEDYKLGCWMVECVWLECIPCSVWWPPKMAQMGWKMDFADLMGCEKLEIVFDGSLIPFYGSLPKYLWLLWWCLFADQLYFKKFEMQKVRFQLFCFSTDFNFDCRFLEGMTGAIFVILFWGNIWQYFYVCYVHHLHYGDQFVPLEWQSSSLRAILNPSEYWLSDHIGRRSV